MITIMTIRKNTNIVANINYNYEYKYTISYQTIKYLKIKSLPCARACASSLRKGNLLAQGTCARNSRKDLRKHLA